MEGKKGYGKSSFGKNSRNEGYKGAARGGRPAGGSTGGPTGGPGGSRGGRPAGGPTGRAAGGPAGARGGRPTGGKDFRSEDPRGGRPSEGRGFKTEDSWGNRPSDGGFGKPADSRGGRYADGGFGKPADSRGRRYADDKGGRTADAGGGRYKDGGFGKSADSRGGRYKDGGFGKSADTRGPRGGRQADSRKSGADSRGADFNTQKHDSYREERKPEVEEFSENQGDLDKLEGRNSVLEALKAGRSINRIFVAKGEREGSISQILAIARQSHILIQEIDRAKLDAMSVTHAHQGVIALTAAKDYVEVDEILERAAESGRPPFIIILDEITDSHNFGSILRTANAAGVHGVIIPKRRAVGLTSVVSKASAGAIEYVPVARVTNIVQTIENLKKKNIWVVGTDSTGEKSYFESDLTGPMALVIGSEGEGMGKLVRESCDFVVSIPMMGQIASLNAAVAGAVVAYEILRQRGKKKS